MEPSPLVTMIPETEPETLLALPPAPPSPESATEAPSVNSASALVASEDASEVTEPP